MHFNSAFSTKMRHKHKHKQAGTLAQIHIHIHIRIRQPEAAMCNKDCKARECWLAKSDEKGFGTLKKNLHFS